MRKANSNIENGIFYAIGIAFLCILWAINLYAIVYTFLISKGYRMHLMDAAIEIIDYSSNNIVIVINAMSVLCAALFGYVIFSHSHESRLRYGVANKKWFKSFCLSLSGLGMMLTHLKMPIHNDDIASLAAGILYVLGFFIIVFSLPYVYNVFLKTQVLDRGNEENESFEQESKLIETPYSINLETNYFYGGRRQGYINIINPFSGVLVVSQPGGGKTGSIIEPAIEQLIAKGFTGCIYDFKYPNLTEYAYSALKTFEKENKSAFYVINFNNPKYSHRCNPLKFLIDMDEAMELSQSFLTNLAKNWSNKRGDFFVESAMNLFAATIWFLKKYQGGKYCTLPHVIEMITSRDSKKLLGLLIKEPQVSGLVNNFLQAYDMGAGEQFAGQLSAPQVMLGRIVSPGFYWALSGDDFSLDLNNPQAPKIVCLANDPDKQETYSTALGLYLTKIVSAINAPNKLPSSIILDELPTLFVRKLDNLIATARSNKIATIMGVQDLPQLIASYGKTNADIIMGLPRNIMCGAVSIDTAKRVSELFGKIKQTAISDTNGQLTERIEMGARIPPDKIVRQQTGHFSGVLALDYDYKMNNVFSGSVNINSQIIKHRLPIINPNAGIDAVDQNFYKIKDEVSQILNQM